MRPVLQGIAFRRRLGLAHVGDGAAGPGIPIGDDRGAVLRLRGDRRRHRLLLKKTDVVATENRRIGRQGAAAKPQPGSGDGKVAKIRDEGTAGNRKGLLGEKRRQILGLIGKEDPAFSPPGDIFQILGIAILFRTHADHADMDVRLGAGFDQLLVFLFGIIRLFGVGGVGKEDDMAVLLFCLHQFIGRRLEAGIDKDAATLGLDAANRRDLLLRLVGRHRLDHAVRQAVDGKDSDMIGFPQQIDHRGGAIRRDLDLLAAVSRRHRHAAGTIQHHRDGDPDLAVFTAKLHRDRQHSFEGRLHVATLAVHPFATRGHQTATRLLDPGGQIAEIVESDLACRRIFNQHRIEPAKPRQR